MEPVLVAQGAFAIDSVVEHQTLAVGDVKRHVALAGGEDGPLVVLLHGFPEFWCVWRHQIEPLARAGCRVIVL